MADWTPQSRAEEILFKTINGEPYDGLPQSRIEELLLELKAVIEAGGGGGGGTYTTTVLFTNGASGDTTFQLSSAYTNFDAIAIYYSHFDGQDQYEDVRIYPTTFLNSVSSTDEVLGFTNDVWYYYFSVYSTTEFRYVKSNAGYITDIIGIKYGSNSGGGGGTDNYNSLKNLPQINGQTIKGNMSGTSLGLVNMVMGKDLSTNDYTNTDKAIVDSVTTDLADKVDKITGKGLSTNDYTNADKSIVDGVTSALAGKVDKVTGKGLSTNDYDNTAKGIVDGVTSALAGKVDTSLVGSSNGVAELDANGRVPSSQLPSYVDDVLEYADLAHFPATGETGKIYIAEDTNKTYRWSGSDYAEISESLALGETSSTAYAGNKGKANADAIAAIKDGTNIDSFGDVETALAGKANSSDIAFDTWIPSNGFNPLTECDGWFCYSVNPSLLIHQGTPTGHSEYATVFGCSKANYEILVHIDIFGRIAIWSYHTNQWIKYNDKEQTVVNIDSAYNAGTDWNIVKQGNICMLNMRNLKDIPNGTTKIGTIPVGFRPEWGFYEYVYSGNTGVHFGFQIGSDGDIYIFNTTGSTTGTVYVNRNITYFTA